MKNIKSYGIIAYNNDSILLIRKRITYAFIEFVNGRYEYNTLVELFDRMTSQEKLLILTFNFRFIWYHCNLTIQDNKYYKKAKIKFDLLQRSNVSNKLKSLICKSKNIELLWEIPKGRQRKCENVLNTSIREFYEETNIKNEHYQILFDKNPIVHSFIDDNVNYIYYYYSAIINNSNFVPTINYSSNNMVFEISAIKFVPIKDLNFYLKSEPFIKDIKKLYKNIKKTNII